MVSDLQQWYSHIMSSIMFVAFFIRPFYKMMLEKNVALEDMQCVVGVAELDISGSLPYHHMTGCGDVQQLKVHSWERSRASLCELQCQQGSPGRGDYFVWEWMGEKGRCEGVNFTLREGVNCTFYPSTSSAFVDNLNNLTYLIVWFRLTLTWCPSDTPFHEKLLSPCDIPKYWCVIQLIKQKQHAVINAPHDIQKWNITTKR